MGFFYFNQFAPSSPRDPRCCFRIRTIQVPESVPTHLSLPYFLSCPSISAATEFSRASQSLGETFGIFFVNASFCRTLFRCIGCGSHQHHHFSSSSSSSSSNRCASISISVPSNLLQTYSPLLSSLLELRSLLFPSLLVPSSQTYCRSFFPNGGITSGG